MIILSITVVIITDTITNILNLWANYLMNSCLGFMTEITYYIIAIIIILHRFTKFSLYYPSIFDLFELIIAIILSLNKYYHLRIIPYFIYPVEMKL